MTVELSRKSWESHKGWNVTGKGLSEALAAFETANTLARKTKKAEDWDALTDRLSDIGEQIRKNKAKLDPKLNKGTHEFLDQLLAVAKMHDKAIVVERTLARQRVGIAGQIEGYRKSLADSRTFLKAHGANELTRAQAMVKAVLDSPKADDKALRDKTVDHIKKTWFNAYHAVYASPLQHVSVLTHIKTKQGDLCTPADLADLDTLIAGFKKVQDDARPQHDAMLAEIKKLGGKL